MNLKWRHIHKAVDSIAKYAQHFNIDEIVTIPRGGLIPAVMVSHKLNRPIRHSIGQYSESTLVLVIDDIIDTGATIQQYISRQRSFARRSNRFIIAAIASRVLEIEVMVD